MPVAAEIALALAGVLGLASTAWVAGRLILRGSLRQELAQEAALAIAAGMAALAQVGLLLGLASLLRPWILGLLVVTIHWAGRGEWRRLLAQARRFGESLPRTAFAFALGIALSTVTMALYPPTGFDELSYHLPMARSFAESGALPLLPDLRYPAFPALAEVLFAELWLWGGELSSHAVSVVATLGTAGLLLSWGWWYRRPSVGYLATALYCGSPIAIYLAGTGYVEPVLALWTVGALFALARFREDGSAAWSSAAALLAGSAASTKYLGLLVLAFVGLLMLFECRNRGWRHAALFCLVAAAAAAPSYVRIWVLTGNPLFPFYSEWFGSSAWDADSFLGSQGAERWRAAATSLWDVVFRRQLLGSLPPFSPALPFLVPLWLWGLLARRARVGRDCGLLVVTFLAFSPMHGHYLAIVLPALALASAEALVALADRLPPVAQRRRIAHVLVAFVIVPGILYAASWVWRFGPPPLTVAAREAYLDRRLELHHTVAALNELAEGETAYGLFAEGSGYYYEGRWLGDHNGPSSYARVLPADADPAAFFTALELRGVGYLVVPEAHVERFAAMLTDPRMVLVRSDGRGRIYRLQRRRVLAR